MRQMSRLRAALRFFWFPLAARRLATDFTPQRRLGNAELAAVGLGFERSLVSAVTCFWPDSGYYSTPSRPQCFKLIQLAAAGQNNESRLGWADPVSSQLDAYPTKTAAKSPFRPMSDGWRPLGQLCSLASMSYTTLAASAAGRYEQTQLTREPTSLGRSPTHQSVAVERANARKTGRQASWTRESIFIFLLPGGVINTMSGYIGVGSLSSPPPRQGDPRNQHLVSGDEIMRRARSSFPNPPAGQQWIRVNNDWQLVSTPDDADAPAPAPEPSAPREHVVLPSDTLQGLCLRYRTSARKLKQANPSLDLGNSSLRGVAVLRIPGSGPAQPVTEEVQMASLRAAVPSLSASEARFYLSVEATVEGAVARETSVWKSTSELRYGDNVASMA